MDHNAIRIDILRRLPLDTATALLLSSYGEERLTRVAKALRNGMGEQRYPALAAVFADIVLAAWENSLLSARAASLVRQVGRQISCLTEQSAAFSARVAATRPAVPEQAAEINRLIGEGDLKTAKNRVCRCSAAEPDNIFWLRFAAFLGLYLGDLDWYEPWLSAFILPPAFSVAFRADYLFARNDPAKAADLYAAAYGQAGLTEWLVREGECRRRIGQRDDARVLWRKAAALRPWQINLRLRLNDLERDADLPGAPPPGRGEILLYSWNHASELDRALAALADSHLASCVLTILDNGSSDTTPDVLQAWQNRLGTGMRRVCLPTNVGAPAARNWLLSLESSRTADWVVFIDDDALVPADWLGFFGTARKLYPKAGIIGCRVVDMASPMLIQSADLHLEANAEAPLSTVNESINEPDFGQYSYLRPAVSVTGCCHLLTRRSIDEVGLFDLRFSPSQFDDFERDLRSCAQGCCPLYQGYLRISHIKRSGVISKTPLWQRANIEGNRVKLQKSYDETAMRAIIEMDVASLLAITL
jgi:GT2 family glycosyltransferase